MAATAETVSFNIGVTGDQQAAAKMERVSASMKKLDSSAADTGKSLRGAGEHIQKLSAVFNSLDPNISKLTGTLGKATGAMAALSSTIGGPAGLAVGGVIGALALWNDYQDQAQKKSEALTKSVADQKVAFEDLVKGYTAANNALKASTDIAEAMALRSQIANDQTLTPDRRAQMAGRASLIEGRVKKAEDASEYKTYFNAQQEEFERELALAGGAPEDKGKGMPRPDTEWETMQRKDASSAQLRKLESDSIKAEVEADRQAGEERLRNKLAAIDAEYQASKTASEQRIEIRRMEAEEYERIEERTAQVSETRRKVVTSGLQNVSSASLDAIGKVARGQKMTTAMFLESIGERVAASGQGHILEGIALSVVNPAQGVPLIAAGGAEFAFGTLLGASAARGAGGSASRGGGRGAGGGGYTPTRSAEPVGGRQQAEPQTTRSNIVVNVNANVVNDDAGVTIIRSIEEAQRRRGVTLSREAVGRV